MARSDDDRPVGYGRPPVGRRWVKGQSGNPSGGRKRAASIADEIGRALAETVEIKERGRRRKVTKGRAAAKQIANASASGDIRAIKLVTDVASRTGGGAVEVEAPLTASEVEIFERLVARIRFGWSKDE